MKLMDTLFVILLVLKLFGLITISWWLVFTPLLIALVASLLVAIMTR